MSNIISARALATEARRLAQREPDRQVSCTYTRFEDDQLVPNCIVGQAAYNLGVSLDDLNRVNSCSIYHLASEIDDRPEWLSVIEDDGVHVHWLSSLQAAQDGGESWGEALHRADRRIVMAQFNI
jgi:hypothetical protein